MFLGALTLFLPTKTGMILSFLCSLSPIAASCQNGGAGGVFRFRSQSHSNLMQAGMRALRRETQKVAAVEMIGEVVQPHFKFLPRREKLILSTGHGSDGARNIFLHGLCGAVEKVQEVNALVHLVLVGSAARIENVGESRRKRQRVHHGVALPDRRHSVLQLYMAAMVAGFTDQQEHA